MPRLNLKDDEMEEPIPLDSDKPLPPPPNLREVGTGGGGGKMSPILMVLVILVVLAGGVYALNYFKVIHLFGKKAPKVAEVIPEAMPPAENQGTTDQGQAPPATTEEAATQTPTPEPALEPNPPQEAAKPSIPPSGTGAYTVQVSSWTSRAKAQDEVTRLSAAGYSAFLEDAVVGGENWFRVRVGRYSTLKEARQAATELQKSMEDELFVARIGG